jgi:hypothetical protein
MPFPKMIYPPNLLAKQACLFGKVAGFTCSLLKKARGAGAKNLSSLALKSKFSSEIDPSSSSPACASVLDVPKHQIGHLVRVVVC